MYKGISLSQELSTSTVDAFDACVMALRQEYVKEGIRAFIEKYNPDLCSWFDENLDGLLSGRLKVWHYSTSKPGFYDIRWGSDEQIKDESEKDRREILLTPFQDIPDIFQKRYGFKLIPDSAWS